MYAESKYLLFPSKLYAWYLATWYAITLHGGSGDAMAATFQVPPPEPFDFTRPEGWEKWFRRFERFRTASGLVAKGEEVQVNTLIYAMGEEAEDILRSFALSEEDMKKYQPVTAKFEGHFVKKRNVIYERARFNMRVQEEGEPVDSFITALYSLSEHCQFGALQDEMLRDRIVVGIRNASLSEKLQLDPTLYNTREGRHNGTTNRSHKRAAAVTPFHPCGCYPQI